MQVSTFLHKRVQFDYLAAYWRYFHVLDRKNQAASVMECIENTHESTRVEQTTRQDHDRTRMRMVPLLDRHATAIIRKILVSVAQDTNPVYAGSSPSILGRLFCMAPSLDSCLATAAPYGLLNRQPRSDERTRRKKLIHLRSA